MLLEIILYISLGFLAAVLFVLIVAPTIWNRAVILTKQKVESSLPLSLNEIQAEKDKLRAEFAMTARRMELGIEELRNKASEQAIELHTKRDETNKLVHDHKLDVIKVEKLESEASLMKAELQVTREKIEELAKTLEDTSQKLEETTALHEALQNKQSNTEEALNKSKIELVASQSKADTLAATLATINLTEDEQASKIAALHEKMAQTKLELKEVTLQSKTSAMEARVATKKLQTAENKIEKLTAKSKGTTNTDAELRQKVSDLTNQLIEENAKVIDMEAKLAQYMLRELVQDGSPAEQVAANPDLEALKAENHALASDIRKGVIVKSGV